jgi:hypothetical protein
MGRKRIAVAKEIIGKKNANGKEYRYTYYVLPLNIYVPKAIIQKWGREFVIEIDWDNEMIKVYPKAKSQNQ